ncbi:hypothetical protein L7F22_047890 [Adiantum nelumboides]|nr:hypothetical protein [Adiantum nelumboides]
MWVLCCMASVTIDAAGELNNAVNSTPCGPSMKCANLGNISYPFWNSASCAASPSYVLSNCSSSESAPYVHWDSLSLALQPQAAAVIRGLTFDLNNGSGRYAHINLTWDTSLLTMDSCEYIFSSHNASQYNIPASINLTGFANDAFEFSQSSAHSYNLDKFDNIYLFFNCTNWAAMSELINNSNSSSLDFWKLESKVCNSQRVICASRLSATSCISLSPAKEVMLQHVMDTLACSHFTFGIVKGAAPPDYTESSLFLNAGLVQLSWTDSECTKCVNSAGGYCAYSNDGGKLMSCQDIEHPYYDDGDGVFYRHRIIQISIGVALSVIAVLLALLGFRYYGKKNISFRDLSSKLVWLAISVLKKVLRRLQQSSYSPNLYIILRDWEGLTERPVEYSYCSIASATKSFINVIGEGGFGKVYKGAQLVPHNAGSTTHIEAEGSDNMQIAVKVLEMRSKHMKNQLLNELGTIGRIHHVNVVRLLGFCVQEDHEMLVYEYVANGSLDRSLFAKRKDGDKVDNDADQRVLDWSERYAIAVGVARGLSYLHEECRHRTVHCDIKPQNILLDDAMSPKIADFGLSRLMDRDESQVVTLARGTPGYMAPEFWRGGESKLSTKFDVYSYGMVLLELISGRQNFAYDDAMGSVCCIPAVAFEAAMQSNGAAILDTRLGAHEDVINEAQWNQIWTVAFVALWCIQDHPASRPSMSEVVQYLEGTIVVSRKVPQPSISISTTPSIAPSSIQISHDRQDFTPSSCVGR